MENDLSTVWRLRDDVSLHWRRLDDDYLIFNAASGQTHIPQLVSEWVLREIENSPITVGTLAAQLDGEIGIGRDIAILRVCEVLAEFSKVGLVEPG